MDHNNLYLDILTENNLENLNENKREIIVLKLWELLGKVTERYTMGDSSSVPEEVVEELLRSICFLLGKFFIDSSNIQTLSGNSMSVVRR